MLNEPETDSTQSEELDPDRTSYLVGVVGEITFALKLNETRGVAHPGQVVPVPGAPEATLGLMYFRGGIEAAVDLSSIWRTSSTGVTADTRVVLVESEGRRALLLVDRLLDLLDNSQMTVVAEKNKQLRLVGQAGEINDGKRLIPLISIANLLKSIV